MVSPSLRRAAASLPGQAWFQVWKPVDLAFSSCHVLSRARRLTADGVRADQAGAAPASLTFLPSAGEVRIGSFSRVPYITTVDAARSTDRKKVEREGESQRQKARKKRGEERRGDMACATDGPLPLDFFFDLDLALMPPTSNAAVLRSPARVVAGMPTAASAPGGGAAPSAACAICMEECEDGKEIPCGHVFHDECISSWLGVQNSCPLCRNRLHSEDRGEGAPGQASMPVCAAPPR